MHPYFYILPHSSSNALSLTCINHLHYNHVLHCLFVYLLFIIYCVCVCVWVCVSVSACVCVLPWRGHTAGPPSLDSSALRSCSVSPWTSRWNKEIEQQLSQTLERRFVSESLIPWTDLWPKRNLQKNKWRVSGVSDTLAGLKMKLVIKSFHNKVVLKLSCEYELYIWEIQLYRNLS